MSNQFTEMYSAMKMAEMFTPKFSDYPRRSADLHDEEEGHDRGLDAPSTAQPVVDAYELAEAMQVQQDLRAIRLELKKVNEESMLQRARAIATASLIEDIIDESKKADVGQVERRLSDPKNSALRRMELLDRAVDEFSKLCGRDLHPVERVDVRKKIGAQTKMK